jgi:hypothetical protein
MKNQRQNKRTYFYLGQAMVETTIIMSTTLLILFALIHFGFVYNAKTVLNYATYEAARAGSLNYGSPQAMKYALARGLAALETTDGGISDFANYQDSHSAAISLIDAGKYVCMQRISPDTRSQHWMPDSSSGSIPNGALNYSQSIPNDHLIYRSAIKKGGVSIQDANLLKIRVTYCHKIITPVIGRTIQRLMLQRFADTDPDPIDDWVIPTRGEFTKFCLENERLPIEAQAVIRMQTPIRDYAFANDCS